VEEQTLHLPSANTTVIVVCTAVASPFSRKGAYRAACTASIAAARSIAGPLTACRLSIRPDFEITASSTTVPCTPAALAIAGYTGRIGASSIPVDTPDDTRTGPTGRSRTTLGVAPKPTASSPNTTLVPIPPGIPTPVSKVGAGPSVRSPCGLKISLRPLSITGTAAAGMLTPLNPEDPARAACTIAGGFDSTGSATRGALDIIGNILGRHIGITTSNPANPTCTVTEPNADHR
jgi:hypothetical protein